MFDQALSATIGRVGFTGEYELDRILFVVYDLGQTVQICEQQVGTFVSCETAAETDQQGVRVDLSRIETTFAGSPWFFSQFVLY